MRTSHIARRILVVDDNTDAADLISEYLAFEGFEVDVAYGGKEAIAKAQAFRPHVIFLDIGMPGMDGYQVATALRSADWFPATRIVALTAWGDPLSRERTHACGFDAHLVKPTQLDTLLKEIALGDDPG